MSMCLIIGCVVLLLVALRWFLLSASTVFPFIVHKYLRERYCEAIQVSRFSVKFCPLILTSISGSCRQQLLMWYLPDHLLFIPSFLYYLIDYFYQCAFNRYLFYFVAQITPALAIRSFFRLVPVFSFFFFFFKLKYS